MAKANWWESTTKIIGKNVQTTGQQLFSIHLEHKQPTCKPTKGNVSHVGHFWSESCLQLCENRRSSMAWSWPTSWRFRWYWSSIHSSGDRGKRAESGFGWGVWGEIEILLLLLFGNCQWGGMAVQLHNKERSRLLLLLMWVRFSSKWWIEGKNKISSWIHF